MVLEMDMDLSYGLMALNMKVIGVVIKLTVKENLFMQTEIFTKANGLMIKPMEKELILMQMVPIIMEIGLMINNMDLEWNLGQMALSMKEIILMVKKKERVNLLLLMEAIMKVSSNKMKSAVMEITIGLTVNNMKVNGVITKCMVKEL